MKPSRRTFVILLTVILTLASVGLIAARIIPDVNDLLTRSLETLETIQDGHAVVEVSAELPADMLEQAGTNLPLDALNGTFEIWARRDAGTNGEPAVRFEILDAAKPELIGLTVVSDGTQFWLYDPNRNAVVVGQAEDMKSILAQRLSEQDGQWLGGDSHHQDFDSQMPETPQEAITKLLEYFTAERAGSEEMAGSDTYQLRLIPIPEQMPEEVRLAGGYLNLWLRSSDQLPVGIEYAEGTAGYAKLTATVAEINIGLDDALFTFTIPEGAEVIQAADLINAMESSKESAVPADFEALTPAVVPEGAVAEQPAQIAGAVVQRFNLSDGQSFFIAQGKNLPVEAPDEAAGSDTVTVRGHQGTLFSNKEGTRTLLTWQENGLTFLVGGDISSDQALAIAGSLE